MKEEEGLYSDLTELIQEGQFDSHVREIIDFFYTVQTSFPTLKDWKAPRTSRKRFFRYSKNILLNSEVNRKLSNDVTKQVTTNLQALYDQLERVVVQATSDDSE